MTAVHTFRPRIFEQDIDIILARRLQHDHEFATAFIVEATAQVGIPPIAFEAVRVRRQARHAGASGTIDILAGIAIQGRETILLLIENKVDSSFTPDQPAFNYPQTTAVPALVTISGPDKSGPCSVGPERCSGGGDGHGPQRMDRR